MGASGFPFPPSLAPQDPKPADGQLAAQKGSLCSPSAISPGLHQDVSSTAPSPSDVRDPSLLPSVLSPWVQPSGRPGRLGEMNVYSPLEAASSTLALPAASPVLHSHQQGEISSPFAVAAAPSLPTPPQDRGRQLRLPSFDKLGIANPHPDNISPDPSKMIMRSVGIFPDLARDSIGSASLAHAALSNDSHNTGSGKGLRYMAIPDSLPKDISVLTPPDDLPIFDWSDSSIPVAGPEQGVRRLDMASSEAASQAIDQSLGAASFPTPDDSEIDEPGKWLDDAIDQITASMDSSNITGHSLRILSHALPSPSIPGHSFPRMIDAIRGRLPSSSLMFINLLHAVPGRFNLSDLPTSPPSTPGQPLGSSNGTGEDYFTAKVFEAAVTAIDYSSSQGLTATPAAAASTQPLASPAYQHFPLAAPSSLNFSIVERYIPPSSRNEFTNLFSVSRPSLVVDRLVELFPGNGCLVLIYPTRTGAETFCEKYLGPIIDPLLRAMVVVNNFSSDLSSAIGRMAAVQHMYEFHTMKHKLTDLCDDLRRGATSNPQVRQRLHGDTGNFSLVYAAKKNVTLEREAWSSWYMKQEKTRVRNAVALHFRYGNRFMADSDAMPTHLIQEIFTGVGTRLYPAGQEPTGEDAKIEIGVFVIKRGR